MNSLSIFGAKYLIAVSVFIISYLFWRSDPEARRRIFRFGALFLPLTYLIGAIARALYYNPRPFAVENFTPLIEHAADNGFPSDHALLASALATLITAFDRRLGVAAWMIAILVAFSRVYTGVHHALDVIASMLISILAGGMIYFFMNKRKQNATNHTNSANSQQSTER